jgi:hypothetical protein
VAADLQMQLESLLDSVWQAERSWRLMDRIDLAIAADERRLRRRGAWSTNEEGRTRNV